MGRRKIEVGQRFERLGRWSRTWQVEAVIEGPGRVANAVLHDVLEPANKCTLSPQALLDRSRYRALGRSEVATQDDRQPDASRKPKEAAKVVPLHSSRQERQMAIESRADDSFRVICTRQGRPHRFVAHYPDGRVTCPVCGYAASAVALLADHTAGSRPHGTVRSRAPGSTFQHEPPAVAPGPAARKSPLAKILTLPRNRAAG